MPISTSPMRLAMAMTLALALALAACSDDSTYSGVEPEAEPDAMPDSTPEATPDPTTAPEMEPEVEPDPEPDPEPSSVIGTACETNAECGFGGFCITDFPEGYCITGCDPADPEACDGGNPCLRLGENDLCVDACESDDDCREGYGCVDFYPETPFCFPVDCREDSDCGEGEACVNGSCGNTSAETGDPCTEDGQCAPGGFCLTETDEMGQPTGFNDGYCSFFNCQEDSDCAGEDAYCAFNGQNNFCLASCETVDDCRARYRCTPLDGQSACVPGDCDTDDDCADAQVCDNGLCGTTDASIGDPCQSNGDCQSGDFCITEESENSDGFYGGYCSRFGCSPNTSGACGDDGICIPIDNMGNGLCLLACEADDECREGGLYECRLLYPQLPESSTSCLPVECFDDADCPEESTCDLLTSVCSQ